MSSVTHGKSLTQRVRRAIPLYLLMLPGILYLLVNNYIPMAGLIIAFKDIDFRVGILASEWIGFANFRYLFASSDAWTITANTLGYNTVFIAVNIAMSVVVAIFLADLAARRMVRFYQSAILLPYLISMIIVSYLGNAFMNNELGFINRVLMPLVGADKIMFYSDPKFWPFILVFINAWKNIGYLCIVFLSTIIGIDDAYFEAASLEGATKMQLIRYITLPMIAPVVIMMVLIFIGRIFYSDFGLFYHVPMNSGALYSKTNVIETYVYRALLKLGDISMSSAAGLYQSVMGFFLVLASNLFVRKVSPDNALF